MDLRVRWEPRESKVRLATMVVMVHQETRAHQGDKVLLETLVIRENQGRRVLEESQVLRKELGESQDLQEGVLQDQPENQGLLEKPENLEMTILRRGHKALLERLGSQVRKDSKVPLVGTESLVKTVLPVSRVLLEIRADKERRVPRVLQADMVALRLTSRESRENLETME